MADTEIQEIERKKRYLKRYRKNLALIGRLRHKIEVLDERMTSVRSPGLSDMPRGGTPVTFADLQAEKSELEDRVKRLEKKSKRLKSEILDVIDEVEDVRYAEVLESFFIDGQSFEDIAEDCGYSTRHVIYLYTEGVKAISLESH